MNILFSQVREDPNIELYVNDLLKYKNDKRYLIVGSGGCTLLTLLGSADNIIIDVIDKNIEQIYLIKLKIAVIKHFKNADQILDFFEGCFSKDAYDNIMNEIDLDNKSSAFWKLNMDFIYNGINQNGTFEKLFKELVESNYDFEKIFDKHNLINKFGENAVINSLNKEFYEHFRNVMKKYSNYDITTNYFYHQIIYNKYNRKCLPPYFYNIDNIIKNVNKVNFINDDFFNYVSKANLKYDMIQTSNLTDWLNKEKINDLLKNINKLLNDHGFIIMRRLNGDYSLLQALINNNYHIIKDMPIDKSEFYSEVVISHT